MVPSGSIVTWSAKGGFPGHFDFSRLNFQVLAQAPAGVSWAFRWNEMASNKAGSAKREIFVRFDFIGLRLLDDYAFVAGLSETADRLQVEGTAGPSGFLF